jgi:hypothetical protein
MANPSGAELFEVIKECRKQASRPFRHSPESSPMQASKTIAAPSCSYWRAPSFPSGHTAATSKVPRVSLLSTLLAAIAEFERELVRQRTETGREHVQAALVESLAAATVRE